MKEKIYLHLGVIRHHQIVTHDSSQKMLRGLFEKLCIKRDSSDFDQPQLHHSSVQGVHITVLMSEHTRYDTQFNSSPIRESHFWLSSYVN